MERAKMWSWVPKGLELRTTMFAWRPVGTFALLCSDLLAAVPYTGQIFPSNIPLLQFMQRTLRSNYSITLLWICVSEAGFLIKVYTSNHKRQDYKLI